MAKEIRLKTVTRSQGNNQALKDGTVQPHGFSFDFEEVPVLIDAFRRMVRSLEFDVSEMALTTYVCARAHGKRFTGLPIFLVRAFHHGAIVYNTKADIRNPKDLEGRRVGVNRGYTVTTGLWARSVLQKQYGVDLNKITWVLSGDEHVAEYRPPANVVPIETGRKMADMLACGELAAAIGIEVDSPDVAQLIPDAKEAGFEALRQSGHYPINHLMVVKDEVLQAHPELAVQIFHAFAEAKNHYVQSLKKGQIDKPTAVDDMHRRVMDITGADPLPYGIAPNRRMLEQALHSALAQGIISHHVDIDSLFAPATQGLVA